MAKVRPQIFCKKAEGNFDFISQKFKLKNTFLKPLMIFTNLQRNKKKLSPLTRCIFGQTIYMQRLLHVMYAHHM